MKNNTLFIRLVTLFLIPVLVLGLLPVGVLALGGTTIYFDNTAGWSVVNIYYWSDSDTAMVSWPGSAMTAVEGAIYSFRIPEGATKVIFNNGSVQTADLTLPENGNLYTYNVGWSTYENACTHEWGKGVVTKVAACTADGAIAYTCELCGDTETETVPALGHSYSDGICASCGAAEYRDVYFENSAGWSAVNIYYWSGQSTNMSVWPGQAMTQVEGSLYFCRIPGDAEQVIFNNGSTQTGDLTLPERDNLYTYDTGWSYHSTCAHSWDEGTETTAASCTAEGVRTYVCVLCGETKEEAIAATGHSFRDGVCTACGAVEPCAEHVWDEGVVTKEPTCWVAGVRTYTCTLCASTKTGTVAAGHDRYVAQSIQPTCISTGKEITKCTRCAYSYDKTLPKIDHAYVAGQVVAPTCTEDGYTVGTCSVCQATTRLDPVYHTGHRWSGTTCTLCGKICEHSYVDGICSGCHDGGPAYVEGYYEISNAAQLYWFAAQVNSGNNGINGRLVADIDLQGGSWISIGYYCSDTKEPETMPYTGIFDGQGHTVSNFTTAGTDNEGLFGYCSSATILNLGVVNAKVTGWRAGAVAGYALTSNVTNCFAMDCTIIGATTNTVALTSGTVYIAPVASPQGGVVRDCYALNCTLIDDTDLAVYTAPVGGVDTQNGYYCDVVWAGEFSTVRNSTQVSRAKLASGEVTWLLNKGVTDGTQGWYQTCGIGRPAHSGNTVYQVTGCAGAVSYSNDPAATGHTYQDGYCTTCGEADPGYQEPVTVPSLTLVAPTLNFEDEIYYNIYYTVSDMSNVVEMGLIAFDQSTPDGTVENADAVIPGYTQIGSEYMSHSNGIPAKMLGDALYFKAYAKLSDGTYAYSSMAGYHAVAYAKDRLTNSNSTKTHQLVIAMLNYGAAAQVQFNYKTDSLMNAFLTAEQQALVSDYSADMVDSIVAVDSSKVGDFAAVSGSFSYLYPSVSFEGAFSINYYFSPAKAMDGDLTLYYWNLEDYNNASVLTKDNATGSVVMEESTTAGEYLGVVEGIAAKEIDQTVFVAGVYESNGKTYCTGVIAYSLAFYCQDRIANGSATMQAFAKATVVYGYYAKAYFA